MGIAEVALHRTAVIAAAHRQRLSRGEITALCVYPLYIAARDEKALVYADVIMLLKGLFESIHAGVYSARLLRSVKVQRLGIPRALNILKALDIYADDSLTVLEGYCLVIVIRGSFAVLDISRDDLSYVVHKAVFTNKAERVHLKCVVNAVELA